MLTAKQLRKLHALRNDDDALISNIEHYHKEHRTAQLLKRHVNDLTDAQLMSDRNAYFNKIKNDHDKNNFNTKVHSFLTSELKKRDHWETKRRDERYEKMKHEGVKQLTRSHVDYDGITRKDSDAGSRTRLHDDNTIKTDIDGDVIEY